MQEFVGKTISGAEFVMGNDGMELRIDFTDGAGLVISPDDFEEGN